MGRPKCWLPFGGERLLARVARTVAQAADPVIVVAAPGQELPEVPAARAIVRDAIADRGPLQGLAAGLRALPDAVDLAFAAATDMAMLTPAWIDRLLDLIGDHDLAIPRIGGFLQPLAALYRRSTVLPVIDRLLAEDRLRTVRLADSTRARIVTEAELIAIDPTLQGVGNFNTPESYRSALERAGFDPETGWKPVRVVVELAESAAIQAGTTRVELVAETVGEALVGLARACPALGGTVIVDDRLVVGYGLSINGRIFVSDPEIPLMDGESLVLVG